MSSETVKCLVWDLDNTLWQGVLLEDGEVRLSEEIRRVVVGLDERGILQSVANNNPTHECLVWDAFAHYGVGVGATGQIVSGNLVVNGGRS